MPKRRWPSPSNSSAGIDSKRAVARRRLQIAHWTLVELLETEYHPPEFRFAAPRPTRGPRIGVSNRAIPKETGRSRWRFAIRVGDVSSRWDHDLRVSSMGLWTRVEANRVAATAAPARPDDVPREVRRAC